VGVAAGRHATPVHRRLGQLVPVDHDHLRVRVGEDPRGRHSSSTTSFSITPLG
jgi:hypothetical protein